MSQSAYSQGFWQDPVSGRNYHYRTWMPEVPRSCLVIIHGFGEHGGRYASVAEWLSGKGAFVIVPDLWGHGKSGGKQGDLGDLSQAIDELSRLTKQQLSSSPNLQHYNLYGHSFGGLMAILWALKCSEGVARTVIQSPLLDTGFKVPAWKELAASVCAHLCPTLRMPMGLDVNQLSQDRQVIVSYLADPLVHDRMSARTYTSMRIHQQQALEAADHYSHPLLLLCGKSDQIISLQAAESWYSHVSSRKRIVLFDECYHELHNEPVREQVLTMIDEWLES